MENQAVLYEDHTLMAFEDIAPQAPVHVLLITRKHIAAFDQLGEADGTMLAHAVAVLNRLAKEKGVSTSGYRVVVNNGKDANQSVGHLHFHLLGGRGLGWPPG